MTLSNSIFDSFSGLGRLEQAEEYLMQANWTVLKTPECSNAIKAKLYRNLGLLYAAKGDYDEALRQLADDVSSFHNHMVLAGRSFSTFLQESLKIMTRPNLRFASKHT